MFTNVDHGKIASDILENRRIQKEFDELDHKIAQLQSKCNSLQQINSQWQSKCKSLEQEISKKDDQIGDIHQQSKNWRSKCNSLKQKISKKDDQIEDLRQQINNWRSKYNNIKQEIANSNQHIQDLNKKVEKRTVERNNNKAAKEASKAVLAARTKQLYMALGLLHYSNPRFFSDPKKRILKFLDIQGRDNFNKYLISKYPYTSRGYKIISDLYINTNSKECFINQTSLEKCLKTKLVELESKYPKWFVELYKYWSPIK